MALTTSYHALLVLSAWLMEEKIALGESLVMFAGCLVKVLFLPTLVHFGFGDARRLLRRVTTLAVKSLNLHQRLHVANPRDRHWHSTSRLKSRSDLSCS